MPRARAVRPGLTAGLIVLAFSLSSCKHGWVPKGDSCAGDGGCPPKAAVCTHPTVHALAHDLDHLEKHIEFFGSVVPKAPDVWGQARLTQHREEFEERMKVELDTFGIKLNGNLARADQAFFAQSVALGIAASPTAPVRTFETTAENTKSSENSINNVIQTTVEKEAAKDDSTPKNTTTDTRTTTNKGGDVGSLVTKSSIKSPTALAPPSVSENAFLDLQPGKDVATIEQKRIGFGSLQAVGIGLEPTEMLHQKSRYLNLLHQLRRTNEGDDTADAPGYSLNLVRIPVSVLPGHMTREGHGAEVTFTLNPVLSNDLLPMTYRTLVINDLVQQLGFPLARFLEVDDAKVILTKEERVKVRTIANGDPAAKDTTKIDPLPPPRVAPKGSVGATRVQTPVPAGKDGQVSHTAFDRDLKARVEKRFVIPTLPPAQGRQARASVPNSQLLEVFGVENCFEIAYQARLAFEESIDVNGYAHVPDVQAYLQSELGAAYRFLAEPNNQTLWTTYCRPEIVAAVRNRDVITLAAQRAAFRTYFQGVSNSTGQKDEDRKMEFSVTAALAWAILVDAALLTDRLVQDMHETATAKGCAPFCAGWLDFAHPNPSPEARQAFNAYVRCRWPVRVFALDPAIEEQNISDTLSTRRETQLALSMAFVSGQINANTLTRYARKLEAEYETIALNRTQVGFAHGENTFGWRFYPRFQTPDTESNLKVLLRDQLIGGPSRNALLRQRRLEPGPRECVAIVITPSFVPYLTCDSVSNWFSLADPKHKSLDHTQAMRISRTVKSLQTCGPTVRDADCYRDGDFARLLRRVEQLDARLPTQTSTVQVPVVNTLGGFEMFNNGTTDLAPELYGFYGAPGARLDGPTTLFLVGDHFSPLRSKVIVGNQECRTEMLSRQVVKVVVPPGALATNDNYVNAHLATPYGVSREIYIPIARPLGQPAPGFAFDVTNWTLHTRTRAIVNEKNEVRGYTYGFLSVNPKVAYLHWQGVPAGLPREIDATFEFAVKGKTITVTRTVQYAASGFAVPVENVLEELVQKLNQEAAPTQATDRPWDGPLPTPVGITITARGADGATMTPAPRLLTPVEVRAFSTTTQ
ncbi:MAG TPA: hypothetical protein VD866_22085 [Urbifossiella sp.]|nr:hypothetical protein [Urbifossiella sp.]